jgi:hypothetical protein
MIIAQQADNLLETEMYFWKNPQGNMYVKKGDLKCNL